ncbi:MAG: TetR family transcriptional regulator [Candidatus Promineifilaceae bacterium]
MARPSNRYQKILIESARLFRESGYLGTSIRDIGDALGITSAALYYHFKNKDELLQAIMFVALNELETAVREALIGETDALERVRIATRVHLSISVEYQDFAIVLLQEARHLKPDGLEQFIAERDAYERIWADLFAEVGRANLYKSDVELNLLRLLMFGMINLVVTWYKPTGLFTPTQIADAIFKYTTTGIIDDDALADWLASPASLTQN